ncbi:MAG: HAD family hydrolase [Chloroflexi bacterium]|nr:MAG: HAD family hydrolase [Chloroflexota bacterium]
MQRVEEAEKDHEHDRDRDEGEAGQHRAHPTDRGGLLWIAGGLGVRHAATAILSCGNVIRAIVFDFDGLILDTEEPVYRSWLEVYEAHGEELPFERWVQIVGSTTTGFHPQYHLEERLLKLGVASSSTAEWVRGHLARLGILERFDCMRCRDDVAHVKPEPDLYVAVLDCLGVPPTEAIAIEDSPNGVTAAKRAGMRCVAIPNSITARLDLSHADLILASLAEVTLQQLLDRVDPPTETS